MNEENLGLIDGKELLLTIENSFLDIERIERFS